MFSSLTIPLQKGLASTGLNFPSWFERISPLKKSNEEDVLHHLEAEKKRVENDLEIDELISYKKTK